MSYAYPFELIRRLEELRVLRSDVELKTAYDEEIDRLCKEYETMTGHRRIVPSLRADIAHKAIETYRAFVKEDPKIAVSLEPKAEIDSGVWNELNQPNEPA